MGKTLAAPAALKAAAKEPRQVGVTIHVGDVKSASGEIQGLLRRLGHEESNTNLSRTQLSLQQNFRQKNSKSFSMH